jgi:hypothetical protein
MKKIAFAVSLIAFMYLSLLSPENASAAFSLPYTYNGHKYSDVLDYSWSANGYDWHQTIYYNLRTSGTEIRYQGDNSGQVYISGAKAAVSIVQAPQYNGGIAVIEEFWNEIDTSSISIGVGTTLAPTVDNAKLYSSQNILNYTNNNVWFYANVAKSLTDGLVGYWSFNNCDATDDSVNKNTGVVNGPQCINGGKLGNAFDFDGINDYIEIPNSASLNPNAVSVSAWFKIKDFLPGSFCNNDWQILVFKKNTRDTNFEYIAIGVNNGISNTKGRIGATTSSERMVSCNNNNYIRRN